MVVKKKTLKEYAEAAAERLKKSQTGSKKPKQEKEKSFKKPK
jgi:hypothetical protein